MYFANGDIFLTGNGLKNGYETSFNILFDSTGEILWEHGDSLIYSNIIFTSDSCFVGGGMAINPDSNGSKYLKYLFKTDYKGKILWKLKLSDLLDSTEYSIFPVHGSNIEEYNGKYWVFYKNSANQNMLLKISSDGNNIEYDSFLQVKGSFFNYHRTNEGYLTETYLSDKTAYKYYIIKY